MTTLLALLALGCAPPPPTEAEAMGWARALAPTFDRVEATLATEIDARLPPFVCRAGQVALAPIEPACVEQKSRWERSRLAQVGELQPVVAAQLGEGVIGVGVLVAGVGTVSAGDRPSASQVAEQGPRQGPRWIGWGSDRGGPFVETVRKMSVGENDVAIRIVVRPPSAP